MSAKSSPVGTHTGYYEELLCHYSNHLNAVELLRQHRPYLETVPSMRRSEESLITIPLPLIQVRREQEGKDYSGPYEKLLLPCDLAIIMCDPEWQVKTDVEIFIFIHHADEDFSGLLSRWRQTQMLLVRDYSWDMPRHQQHMYSEGADKTLPLFVLLEDTPPRIQKGLQGAGLPFVIETFSGDGQLNPKLTPPVLEADNDSVTVIQSAPDQEFTSELLSDLWLPEALDEQEAWLEAHLPDYVQECPEDNEECPEDPGMTEQCP
jgi:hypothetical protein